MALNENIIKGKWQEIKGEVREVWGKLTDNELEETRGDIQQIRGLIQKKYGQIQEEHKRKLDHIFEQYDGHMENDNDDKSRLRDMENH